MEEVCNVEVREQELLFFGECVCVWPLHDVFRVQIEPPLTSLIFSAALLWAGAVPPAASGWSCSLGQMNAVTLLINAFVCVAVFVL